MRRRRGRADPTRLRGGGLKAARRRPKTWGEMSVPPAALVSLTSSTSTYRLSVHRAGDLFVVADAADGRLLLYDRAQSAAEPVAWRRAGSGWSHVEFPEFEFPGIAIRPHEG